MSGDGLSPWECTIIMHFKMLNLVVCIFKKKNSYRKRGGEERKATGPTQTSGFLG